MNIDVNGPTRPNAAAAGPTTQNAAATFAAVATATTVGVTGPPGIGVPPGGAPSQALLKNSATDYDTTWGTVTGGSGGGGPAYNYRWSTGTTVADPGSGKLSLNNATLTAATTLSISVYDQSGGVVRLDTLNVGDTFILYVTGNLNALVKYTISATPTNNANTWFSIPVTWVSTGSAGFTPTNNASLQAQSLVASHGLPPGGATQTVLVKNTAANYDAGWSLLGSAAWQAQSDFIWSYGGGWEVAVDNGTVSTGTFGLAPSQGNVQRYTLGGNVTFNPSLTGTWTGTCRRFRLFLKQDGVGSRTVTWTNVTWAGSAPILATAPNAVDVVTLLALDDGTTWYGYQEDIDLTNYLTAAGKAGAQTYTMSTNNIGNLTGSNVGTTAAALNIRADTSNTTGASGSHLGNIYTVAPVHMMETNVAASANETLTADPGAMIQARGTKTLNFANSAYAGGQGIYCWRGALAFQQNSIALASYGFKSAATYKNNPGTAGITIGNIAAFDARDTWQADGAAVTVNATNHYFSDMAFSTINTGTLTAITDFVNYEAALHINDAGVSMTGGYASFSAFTPVVTGAGAINQFSGFRILSGTTNAVTVVGLEFGASTGGAGTTSQYGIRLNGFTAGAATTTQTGLQVNAITGGQTNVGVNIAAPSGGSVANLGIQSAGTMQATGAASVLVAGTGGIGFTTGAGGAVTQATSRTTGVTLNKATGAITLFSAAGSATWAAFTLTNSTIGANDIIDVHQKSGANAYSAVVTNVAAGSCVINISAFTGTATEAPVFSFAVTKGAIV